ncbi:hypothetical protein [Clostridium sporogenes]|uniref:hypothetical protein n=1 Tax=Clostridium sporogenes TaxID=1509 RepID=UPI00024BA9E5|nr:hypothetical protein [Clostridium sporogenes]EHN13120.1 hypothetical protein IYC_20676 [Clostridium sporogenes PA 3679]MDU4597895.1 hypothetical protein [Clostridium sporogenes]NFQ35070.1 hypothetical protein [Clostridium sporogenes]NFQ60898.1 hypothetical protein [Clostridium sporogenes]NFU11257.1 hypothetical protein [Clostridium sporogenes]
MPQNSNEYDRLYKKREYDIKKGKAKDMTLEKKLLTFTNEPLSIIEFKNFYKDKLDNKEQELIFNNCLNLIDMINKSRECLEEEGMYIKNVTGTLRANPAGKELRECLKAFNIQLKLLHELLCEKEAKFDANKWLDD